MTDNSWYERGELPPIGMRVKTHYPNSIHESATQAHGREVRIVSHDGDVAIFEYEFSGTKWYHGFYSNHFRPLKSDRDKAIEAACNIVGANPMSWVGNHLGKLYDAGLLRLPD